MKTVMVAGEECSMRRLRNDVFCIFDIFEVQSFIQLETLVEGYLGIWVYRGLQPHTYLTRVRRSVCIDTTMYSVRLVFLSDMQVTARHLIGACGILLLSVGGYQRTILLIWRCAHETHSRESFQKPFVVRILLWSLCVRRRRVLG